MSQSNDLDDLKRAARNSDPDLPRNPDASQIANRAKQRRLAPVTLRGKVGSITFSDPQESATLRLDEQKVTISRVGSPILISVGDRVLVVGSMDFDCLKALFYINESNGDNSVDRAKKDIRKFLAIGTAALLAAVAIVATVATGSLRGLSFLSGWGVAQVAIYLASIAGAVALAIISGLALFAASYSRRLLGRIERARRGGHSGRL